MDTTYSTVPCIIVDWDTYTQDDSDIAVFLVEKAEFYDVIVFVADPARNDYNDHLTVWDATAVIRNSVLNPLANPTFKATALATIQDGSNLFPVLAFDRDMAVQIMFEGAGILMALPEVWL
jgi:hypothetical protein